MANAATDLGGIERTAKPTRGKTATAKPVRLLQQYFYFFMSLLIAVIVVYGFSHTIGERLIHAAVRRPFILYLHAAIFFGWVLFFIFQSLLVRTHKVRLHRQIGWFGVALGVAISVLGISTAITMTRFQMFRLHAVEDAVTDLLGPFLDMTSFTIPFALAIYWRKKPEFHRRLLLVATCALTSAAFSRMPLQMLPVLPNMLIFIWIYGGVDVLIFLGVVRDMIVDRRIHRVYLYALPALLAAQAVVICMYQYDWALCVKIAHAVVG
jgi:hypothetical protein